MTIFRNRLRVCNICDGSAEDDSFFYNFENREYCICKNCKAAIEAVSKSYIDKQMKKLKPKTTTKKKAGRPKKVDE